MGGLLTKIPIWVVLEGTESWNHKLRMILLKPILLIDGGIGGIVVLIVLDHRGVTVGPDGVFTLGMMLAMLFTGYLTHAIID